MIRRRLLSDTQSSLIPDRVFNAGIYTGTGAPLSIANNINLTAVDGLVWTKDRDSGVLTHSLIDTIRGNTKNLASNLTAVEGTDADRITAFNANGFDLGTSALHNTSADDYVAWTFQRAAKFFDIITWTGDGSANRQLAHDLTIVPGMILVKELGGATNWQAYHIGTGSTVAMQLNLTSTPTTSSTFWNNTDPTVNEFTVSSTNNGSGLTYVAYLFAHDVTDDGIIQCGTFTTDGGGNATISLGWEPQFVMTKISSGAGHWQMSDTARGMPATGAPAILQASSASAEFTNVNGAFPNADGFTFKHVSAATFTYLAIHEPILS